MSTQPSNAEHPAAGGGAAVDDQVLAAAGVLCRNEAGDTLLVTLTYDRHCPFAVPGGGLEEGEVPRVTAARELSEELGLPDVELGELACVDYVLGRDRPPIVAYLYWAAGPLTVRQIAAIRPQPSEISGFAFHSGEECARLLPPRLGRRVAACHAAAGTGPVALVASRPFDPQATADGLVAAERARSGPRFEVPDGVVLPMDRATYLATRPRVRCRAEVLLTDAGGRIRLTGSRDGLALPGGPVPVRAELPQQTASRHLPTGAEMAVRAVDWCTAAGARPTLTYLFDGGTVTGTEDAQGVWAAVDELDALLPSPDASRVRAALVARAQGRIVELVDGKATR